jgi:hypothetical protein
VRWWSALVVVTLGWSATEAILNSSSSVWVVSIAAHLEIAAMSLGSLFAPRLISIVISIAAVVVIVTGVVVGVGRFVVLLSGLMIALVVASIFVVSSGVLMTSMRCWLGALTSVTATASSHNEGLLWWHATHTTLWRLGFAEWSGCSSFVRRLLSIILLVSRLIMTFVGVVVVPRLVTTWLSIITLMVLIFTGRVFAAVWSTISLRRVLLIWL